MYKTLVISVKCGSEDHKYLSKLNAESASVWNRCLEIDQDWFKRTGKYVKPSELQTALLGFSYLPRASVYHVYRKYLAARAVMNSIVI